MEGLFGTDFERSEVRGRAAVLGARCTARTRLNLIMERKHRGQSGCHERPTLIAFTQ